MDLKSLFELMDNLIGDKSAFKGLTFEFEHGELTIDFFDDGGRGIYICDFKPTRKHNSKPPVSFAAVGKEELEDQIKHYVLI